ncbi:MAG: hypothetical protein IIB26_03650 [Chloroflexi bacterium]|nr:hypothetical protein [Chloroflexota bacterium]
MRVNFFFDSNRSPCFTQMLLKRAEANTKGDKPYDHVMFRPAFTSEIDVDFDMVVVDLVEAIARAGQTITLTLERQATPAEPPSSAGPVSVSVSVSLTPPSFTSTLLRGAAGLVPRETPLSLVHLRNMTAVTEAGAVVLPAMPGFYHRPRSVQDLVDMIAGRVLDQLGVESHLLRRWQGAGD